VQKKKKPSQHIIKFEPLNEEIEAFYCASFLHLIIKQKSNKRSWVTNWRN